jgi:hypothetical protein
VTFRQRVDWETCSQASCIGVRVGGRDVCLAHLPEEELQVELRRIGKTGGIDARGVRFTEQLFSRLFDTLPKDRKKSRPHRILRGKANFGGAYFEGDASFSSITFEGPASFAHATFELQNEGPFYDTTFNSDAWFMHCRFEDAGFFKAEFKGDLHFAYSEIRGTAWFASISAHGLTDFRRTLFAGESSFEGSSYRGRAIFDGCTFRGASDFSNSYAKTDLSFDGARFEAPAVLLDVTVGGTLSLSRATFTAPADVEIDAKHISCRRASFPGGVRLCAAKGVVDATNASFLGPSVIFGRRYRSFGIDVPWAEMIELIEGDETPEPLKSLRGRLGGDMPQQATEGVDAGHDRAAQRASSWLESLAGAEVANLTVADIDLSFCRFYGAHGLDRIKLEGDPSFGGAPRRKTFTRRKIIVEERAYRRDPANWSYGIDSPEDTTVYLGPMLEPSQIADLYRALRKSREDSKDEPGAADFYYGEMEMRRLGCKARARTARQERRFADWLQAKTEGSILLLYWLVSGYGLRAWRAVTALSLLLLLSAAYYTLFDGLDSGTTPATALLFSLQSVTALLRGPERQVSSSGEWIQLALRFLGPVLLGLIILSVRGRVKR